MDAAVRTAIAAGASLLGVALGYLGSSRLSDRERRAARSEALRNAIARYLGALYAVVAELRQAPATESTTIPDAIDRFLGDSWSYVRSRRRAVAAFGTRPFELTDRLADAAAQLQVLPLDAELRKAFDAANEYVERLAEHRTDEVKADWSRIHARMMSAIEARPELQAGH